jgi:hypothetical protein
MPAGPGGWRGGLDFHPCRANQYVVCLFSQQNGKMTSHRTAGIPTIGLPTGENWGNPANQISNSITRLLRKMDGATEETHCKKQTLAQAARRCRSLAVDLRPKCAKEPRRSSARSRPRRHQRNAGGRMREGEPAGSPHVRSSRRRERSECRREDSNLRTTKDGSLNPTPLTSLGNSCGGRAKAPVDKAVCEKACPTFGMGGRASGSEPEQARSAATRGEERSQRAGEARCLRAATCSSEGSGAWRAPALGSRRNAVSEANPFRR